MYKQIVNFPLYFINDSGTSVLRLCNQDLYKKIGTSIYRRKHKNANYTIKLDGTKYIELDGLIYRRLKLATNQFGYKFVRLPDINGKHTLKGKYKMDKEEALRRQSRPGAQNGRATSIKVYDENHNFIREFDYIGEACEYLIQEGFTKSSVNSIRGNIWKANKDKSMYLKHYFEY